VSYKKQQLLTIREHLSSPLLLSGVRVAYLFCLLFFVLSYYVSIRAEFHVLMSVTYRVKAGKGIDWLSNIIHY
jgi:hypothetical protein